MGNLKIFSKITFEKIKKEFKENKKIFSLIILFFVFAATTFEIFNRPFGEVSNIKIPFDDKIPMVKELILVYHTFSLMFVLTGFLLLIDKKDDYMKYVISLFVAQILAYIIYVKFQTYIERYDTSLLGDDIFSNLIRLTYQVDNSYSGAPSLHVCVMTLASIYFAKSNYTLKTKIFYISYLILIALTTVLVKQHVVLDIPAGILHAIIVYFIVEFGYNKYKKKN